MKNLLNVVIIFTLLFSSVLAFEKEKKMVIDVQNIEKFEIKSGSGFLSIEGVKGLNEIAVEANIIIENVSDKKAEKIIEKQMQLSLEKINNTAVLVSKIKVTSSSFFQSLFNGGESAKIDLIVKVPANLLLIVKDGSGGIELFGEVKKTKIDDGSGKILVNEFSGDLEIDDGSGSIKIEKADGRFDIEDGSGSITIIGLSGDLKIRDSSGGIKVYGVEGDVNIDDSSGTIKVKNVDGTLVIDDGSGGINIDEVEKDVIIKNSGSGSLKIGRVKGKVERYDK